MISLKRFSAFSVPKDEWVSHVLKGGVGVGIIRLLNISLGMLSSILLARLLGVEAFGVFAFSISLITLISFPLRGGVPTYVTREVAKGVAHGEWGNIKGIIYVSFVFIFVVSLFVWALYFLLLESRIISISDSYMVALANGIWLVPIMSILILLNSILKGMRKVVIAAFSEQFLQPFLFVLLVALAVGLSLDLSAAQSLRGFAVSALVASVVSCFFLFKLLPARLRGVRAQANVSGWFKGVLPLIAFSGIAIANGQINLVLLGFMGEGDAVGIFRVAMQISVLVGLGLTIVNSVVAPHIVRMNQLGQHEGLQKMLFFTSLVSVCFATILFFIFVAWGELIVRSFFGGGYILAYAPLVVLSFSQFVNVVSGSVALVLNMCGYESETVKVVGVAFLVNILISVLAIPEYSYMGAAIGVAMSQVLWNLVLVRKAIKLTGYNPTIFNKKLIRI